MRTLIGLLCFLPLVAWSATWVEIGVSNNSRIDMDKDSVDENPTDHIKAWFREEALIRRQNAVGNYYRSAVTYELFICEKRMSAIQKAVYYSDPDLNGNIVNDMDFEVKDNDYSPVIPGTLGELKMKQACVIAKRGK